MTYFTVEWSGGGGWGHYAWLLADALARTGRCESVLLTRSRHELGGHAHGSHSVVGLWKAPPAHLSGGARTLFNGAAWLAGWSRVVGIGLSKRLKGERAVFHLHGFESVPAYLAALALRCQGHVVVVTAHNALPHDSGRLRKTLMAGAYRIPSVLVAHTEEVRSEVSVLTGRSARNIGVIPHASYAALGELLGSGSARRGVGPRAALNVAFLGHIKPYKGLEFAVEVFRALTASGVVAHLSVVGQPEDKVAVRRVLQALPEGTYSADLRYIGVDELANAARDADVLLLGHRSLSESGIAHLALGVGTPVVGPRLGAIQRMLTKEEAWLYEPGDAASAVRALRSIAEAMSSDEERLRQRARSLAAGPPTWEESAEAHLDLIRSVSKSVLATP